MQNLLMDKKRRSKILPWRCLWNPNKRPRTKIHPRTTCHIARHSRTDRIRHLRLFYKTWNPHALWENGQTEDAYFADVKGGVTKRTGVERAGGVW